MRLCRVQSGCQGEIEERDGKASEDDPVYYGAARVHSCIMGNNIRHIEYHEKKKNSAKVTTRNVQWTASGGIFSYFSKLKIKILQHYSVSLIAKTVCAVEYKTTGVLLFS